MAWLVCGSMKRMVALAVTEGVPTCAHSVEADQKRHVQIHSVVLCWRLKLNSIPVWPFWAILSSSCTCVVKMMPGYSCACCQQCSGLGQH
jgi:hypothetical protein